LIRIIAGPCQHETLAQSAEIAKECKRVCDKYGIEYYFKASYDKANRSSANSVRGQGLECTLADLAVLKDTLGVNTLTDVHDYVQVRRIEREFKNAVDVYQIPAFLCRQTDLIQAACDTDKIVNIKKGQFMAPSDVAAILTKTQQAKEVWITERGTSFGYGRLINDFTGMHDLLVDLASSFVYDLTHSVQTPGANGSSSGGDSRYVPHLARAGAALGITSFFIETHADPYSAPSDGEVQLHLDDFERTVDGIHRYSYTR